MASVYTFVDGKLMFKDEIAYANGDFVSLKDYKILEDKTKSLKCELDKTYNQLQETEKEAQEKIAELESELAELKNNSKTQNETQKCDKNLKINLNDCIKVKLTPLGTEIYYKQYDALNKDAGKTVLEPRMPQIDKDGYTMFQLWHFIELYGEHIGMCKPNVIKPIEIILCE